MTVLCSWGRLKVVLFFRRTRLFGSIRPADRTLCATAGRVIAWRSVLGWLSAGCWDVSSILLGFPACFGVPAAVLRCCSGSLPCRRPRVSARWVLPVPFPYEFWVLLWVVDCFRADPECTLWTRRFAAVCGWWFLVVLGCWLLVVLFLCFCCPLGCWPNTAVFCGWVRWRCRADRSCIMWTRRCVSVCFRGCSWARWWLPRILI